MTSQAEQPGPTGLRSLAYRYVPIVAWLPEYKRAHLMPDAVAALNCQCGPGSCEAPCLLADASRRTRAKASAASAVVVPAASA